MSLEEMLAKKIDVEQQLDEALRRERDNQAARDSLQQEIESASDYILELEEKVYKANKTSLELLKQLKDAELEIETLKQYIVDLKQRIAVYIPVKDD
jgi:chromosome segregation ATPase